MKPNRTKVQLFTRAAVRLLEPGQDQLGDDIYGPMKGCGRIRAAILTYGVVDSFGTAWQPGCMDKTRAKVAAGKVDFFIAADDGRHQYGINNHIGTLRALEREGDQEIAVIDLLNTEESQKYKAYVSDVMEGNGNTGYSVGVWDRSPKPTYVKSSSGQDIYVFTEVELDELTATARPAVPGTRPLAVRSDEDALPVTVQEQVFDTLALSIGIVRARARLGALEGNATAHEDPPADEAADDSNAQASRSGEPEFATEEDRVRVLRATYA